MADQYDQTPAPVESTVRSLFGYGGKKKEVESAEKAHVSEVEPKKESGGGILGMFGYGGKKKEEVPSENEFSSEAPETVQASKVEHESSGRGLIGTKEEGVKPGSAFSSEPTEKVHFSEDVEPKHPSDNGSVESTDRGLFGFGGKKAEEVQTENTFNSESDEKVHFSEDVEPKHESLAEKMHPSDTGTVESTEADEGLTENTLNSESDEKVHFSKDVEPKHESLVEKPHHSDTGSVESTDRGLFGFEGKKAEEGRTENTFNSESDEKVHFSEDVEPKHESLVEKPHHPDTGSVESTDRGLFGFEGKKAEEGRTENTFNSESDEKVHFSEDVEPKHESLVEKPHHPDTGSVESTDRGLFGFGGKKAEEGRTENTFNSESDEKVHFSEDVEPKHESLVEKPDHSDTGSVESTDRSLFGFGGKKAEEGRTENTFNSESDENVHFSEDVEPKHESLVEKPHHPDTGSVESTDRGLFGFGGKKAEEVRTENTLNSESDEKVHFSKDVEPKQESLAENLHPSATGSVEPTDRGLFGFGGKKAEEVRSENKFSSEPDENVHVSEDVEPKHESLLEQMHLSDQDNERTSNGNAFSSENEEKVPVSDVEPYHAGESTDRGLFGLGGKKKEEVDSENGFNSEFEQKLQVSETEPKKESLLHEPHRPDSSSTRSSDEEEVEEGGVKKEKIKDKISGTDKKTEEVNKYHEQETSFPTYNSVPPPVHQVQPEEKKGFMEKMKDKLPGHKKVDEFTPVAPPPAAVDHGPITPTGEKKGLLSKIKDKLHHSKTDEEKEIEKEKNQY